MRSLIPYRLHLIPSLWSAFLGAVVALATANIAADEDVSPDSRQEVTAAEPLEWVARMAHYAKVNAAKVAGSRLTATQVTRYDPPVASRTAVLDSRLTCIGSASLIQYRCPPATYRQEIFIGAPGQRRHDEWDAEGNLLATCRANRSKLWTLSLAGHLPSPACEYRGLSDFGSLPHYLPQSAGIFLLGAFGATDGGAGWLAVVAGLRGLPFRRSEL